MGKNCDGPVVTREPVSMSRRGRLILLAVALAGLLSLTAAPVAATIGERLVGRWAGAFETPGAAAETVSLELAREGESFTVGLRLDNRPVFGRVRMIPAEKPGVFRVARSHGLFSLFRDDATSNPLENGPLLWARETDAGVVLYRLEVTEDGGFSLDRFALSPAGKAIALAHIRLSDKTGRLESRAVLEAEG